MFDSAAPARARVPILASQTIPGFSEALAQMQEGGRYKVHIPSKLGYGHEPPAGGPIPPDAQPDVRRPCREDRSATPR